MTMDIEPERITVHRPRWWQASLRSEQEPVEIGYLDRLRQATPKWADRKAMQLIYKQAAKMTRQERLRRRKGYVGFSVDHIIPLKGALVCGLHVLANLRIVRVTENSRKRNIFIESVHELPMTHTAIYDTNALDHVL